MSISENASYGNPPACRLAKGWMERLPIIEAWLRILLETGSVVECRQLKVMQRGYANTYSGFFDSEHFRQLWLCAKDNEQSAAGTYFTLNPLHGNCLAVRANTMERSKGDDAAKDADVIRRRWLLIDADSERKPVGISSTDEEKAHAWRTIKTVQAILTERGWPAAILADSGNGYHLLFRVDLLADDDGLVKRVLEAIAHLADDVHVKIDRTVFNPGRICKLPGTWARKGSSVSDRPHRLSFIIEIPGCSDPLKPVTPAIGIVTKEQLEALAAELAPPPAHKPPAAGALATRSPADRAAGTGQDNGEYKHRLDVARWLADRGIDFREEPRNAEGFIKFILAHCLFNQEHKAPDSYIAQHESGALVAKCSHNSCAGRGWPEFKGAIGKPGPEHFDPPFPRKGRAPRGRRPARSASNSANGIAGADGPGASTPLAEQVQADREADEKRLAKLTPNEADDDPHRLARLISDNRYDHADHCKLAFWRDEWHTWDGQAWRAMADKEMRGQATADVKAEFNRLNINAQGCNQLSPSEADAEEGPPEAIKVTIPLISNVLNALASMTGLPARTEPPAWLDGRQTFLANEILACRNGLIHLPSVMTDTADYFLPATPAFFSPNCLDYDFDFKAPAPSAWLNFLADLWPDDMASVETLQEWMGYLLTPDTRQQKILMLVGDKRSGKGTIARVITGLIGQSNIAGPTLSSLSTNFGLWPLVGKAAAIISDARLGGKTDVASLTERLLSISGEDAQTVDRKNLPHWTGKLTARFMILTNELPNLADASGALASRMILLRLAKSWFGKEDTRLSERLLTELPSVLRWAIDGLARLRDRGHFVQPLSGMNLLEELTDLASPVKAFVGDVCNLAPEAMIEKTLLFEAWRNWAEQHHRDHKWDAAQFGRRILAAFSSVKPVRRGERDSRAYFYQGICLK